MQLALTVRDLEPHDLSDLSWSGGPEHLKALAEAWQASLGGDVVTLVVALPNGRLVASGAVDFRLRPGLAVIWMLSVHEIVQNMGIGSWLVAALEERVLARGAGTVRMNVEQDNLRAAALYRRLGYQEVGSMLESWAVAGGRTYVTVSASLQRELSTPPQ